MEHAMNQKQYEYKIHQQKCRRSIINNPIPITDWIIENKNTMDNAT